MNIADEKTLVAKGFVEIELDEENWTIRICEAKDEKENKNAQPYQTSGGLFFKIKILTDWARKRKEGCISLCVCVDLKEKRVMMRFI